MRSRSKQSSTPIDPRPVMPRGETEFEEKRVQCEFTLNFSRISKMSFSTFKEATEYIFRQGYFTGKAAKEREAPTHVPTFIALEDSPTSE